MVEVAGGSLFWDFGRGRLEKGAEGISDALHHDHQLEAPEELIYGRKHLTCNKLAVRVLIAGIQQKGEGVLFEVVTGIQYSLKRCPFLGVRSFFFL